MEDLIGVSIADAAEQSRIREGPFKGVILGDEHIFEIIKGSVKNLYTAGIKCG